MADFEAMIRESLEVKKIIEASDFADKIKQVADIVVNAFRNGNKLLIAGNGGSAAQASHLAAEFVGRYKADRKGLPAIALSLDSSFVTAWANDYDYESVFVRQLHAFAKKGDIFISISTSGNSMNVIKAVAEAKKLGIFTISFLGKGGGKMKGISDIDIIIPSNNTPIIQENHLAAFHLICEAVDEE